MYLRSSLLCLCLFSGVSQAAVNCSALAEKISGTVPEFHPALQGEVIGTGRVHFHLAPDDACANKKIFVVPGDAVTIYSILEDQSWLEVNFVAKDGEDYTGWVKADRIKKGVPYGAPPDGE
ncbi:hypothetical protein M2401_005242 [Pseudomonas sp. JUb42]|jgi:hypothetical protein|uniref:hypothetical protein n=1 Tax=Pseudomonas sp. JUb42 TaxID=2940611 RepID=UPI0021683278|nr:hypothetical protein [Pseudomonas sp. JUb42]MCS3471478.1 hypothetical protein [Pseudomonas sp. JUb42]